jgi:hypothetical protein
MKHLLTVARAYVIFDATTGFLFGQIFFGRFDLAAFVSGVFGLVAGVLSAKRYKHSVVLNRLVLISCLVAIGGVVADAYRYYSAVAVPGNDYHWFLGGLFVVGLVIIASSRLGDSMANTSFKGDALKRAP